VERTLGGCHQGAHRGGISPSCVRRRGRHPVNRVLCSVGRDARRLTASQYVCGGWGWGWWVETETTKVELPHVKWAR